MSLKKEFLDKIPRNLNGEPHVDALLDNIKEHNIETKEHLVDFLQKQTDLVEKWLEDNGTSHLSATKSVREKTIHLEVLKKCSKLTEEFLL